jgi:hypothetical protein
LKVDREQVDADGVVRRGAKLSDLTALTQAEANSKPDIDGKLVKLSGKVVFIPGAEQGIMPSSRALQATGLLIEQRRLFYVSVTRAMACCIVSHAAQHTGAQAMALTQTQVARLTRSQFLNEMSVSSVTRTSGLSQAEAAAIVSEVNNL